MFQAIHDHRTRLVGGWPDTDRTDLVRLLTRFNTEFEKFQGER
ncbi:hypothetical protein [Actinokineospora pegani]|nr:hypothetical protein [Actinokineospora pegani]